MGNERREIFYDDEDRRLFLDTVAEMWERPRPLDDELLSYIEEGI